MRIFFTPRFERSFNGLTPELQQLARIKIDLFRENPFSSTLHSHKLSHSELWAFSVDNKNRVIFKFQKDAEALLINVGDHSIYRKIG